MTRLLVVRHAESEWNALGRWQGWGDPPLSPKGRDQAASAAARVAAPVQGVVTSDLRRARETAEILADRLGLGEVRADAGLREIDVGEWTGLTHREIEQRWPGLLAEWRALRLDAAPGGESRTAMLERVRSTLERLADDAPGDLLVVSHSAAIHALERALGLFEDRRLGNLEGRWFEAASPLRGASARVALLG